MKNLVKIFIGLALAGSIASCGLLDENPSTSLSETTVYSTPEALNAALNGCYRGLYNDTGYQGNMNEFLMPASGITHWKGNRTVADWTDCLKFTWTKNAQYNPKTFAFLMTAVNYCNKLLDALPASPVSQEIKDEKEGEAKLLRGILYYTLVRMYGDVTLYTHSPKNIDETSNPRTAYYKVYCQVVKDFEDAERLMPTAARQAQLTGDLGRPCNWAGTAFLASVYMTIGSILDTPADENFYDSSKDAALIAAGKDPRTPDFSAIGVNSAKDAWEKALYYSEKVINEGPYRLAEKYSDLFRWTDPADFHLAERIFVLNASPKAPSGIYTAVRSLPQCPEGANQTASNSNAARWCPSRWIYQKWCETYGGNHGTGTYNSDIFVSCDDPRLDVTMFHNSYMHTGAKAATNVYPNNSAICSVSQGSTDLSSAGSYAYPLFKKYLDPRYNANAGYADFYMLRFAEMYLIAAEAHASLSEGIGDAHWQAALENIEVIHARARRTVAGATQPSWAEWTFANKEELVNAIMWERIYEMMGEGHEYYDTHRRGAKWIRDNIAIPKNAFLLLKEQGGTNWSTGAAVSNGGYTKYYHGMIEKYQYPTDISEIRKGLLCEYPENEFTYNSSIDINTDQNDFHF